MGVVRGKRGCSLKMAFLLHLAGFLALFGGCLTPYWSRLENASTGEVLSHEGLLIYYTPGGDWTMRDLNKLKSAGNDDKTLYLALSVGFGLGAVIVEFLLLEAFAFAVYNRSCGDKYNPDCLMIFCLLTGAMAITSLVTYEQYTGRDFNASTEVMMDYSRGLVVIFVAASFLAAFFTVCDRKEKK